VIVARGARAAATWLVAGRPRAAPALLGIVAGVSAAMLLAALRVGASPVSRIVTISSLQPRTANVAGTLAAPQGLSEPDVQALSDPVLAPDVAAVAPLTGVPGTLLYRGRNWQARTIGSNQDFAQVRGYQMAVGSFFGVSDVQNSAKVVVLGQGVVDGLFGGDPSAALDQTVQIQRRPFRVVGTFAPRGSGDQDDVALIPITAAWNDLLGGRGEYVDQILVEARDADAVSAAEGEATQILLDRHKVADPSRAGFQARSQEDTLASEARITGLLSVALGVAAAAGLVLGTAGIASGVAAVGAGRFSFPSAARAGSAGLLGVALGAGLASLGDALARRTGGGFPAPVLSTSSVALALGLSLGIGLFFGVQPARRVLGPVHASRYE
jgi:putative ABC transport system permease protein